VAWLVIADNGLAIGASLADLIPGQLARWFTRIPGECAYCQIFQAPTCSVVVSVQKCREEAARVGRNALIFSPPY
jgi:hypothetical protein